MRLVTLIQNAALCAGLVAAALALYGRYRVLPAVFTGPRVCRLEAGGCQALFRTRAASLLGMPNAALGLVLYVALLIGAARGWPPAWLLAGASLALAVSIYLAGYLIANRLECRICWVGHAANLLLWVALLSRVMTS